MPIWWDCRTLTSSRCLWYWPLSERGYWVGWGSTVIHSGSSYVSIPSQLPPHCISKSHLPVFMNSAPFSPGGRVTPLPLGSTSAQPALCFSFSRYIFLLVRRGGLLFPRCPLLLRADFSLQAPLASFHFLTCLCSEELRHEDISHDPPAAFSHCTLVARFLSFPQVAVPAPSALVLLRAVLWCLAM